MPRRLGASLERHRHTTPGIAKRVQDHVGRQERRVGKRRSQGGDKPPLLRAELTFYTHLSDVSEKMIRHRFFVHLSVPAMAARRVTGPLPVGPGPIPGQLDLLAVGR